MLVFLCALQMTVSGRLIRLLNSVNSTYKCSICATSIVSVRCLRWCWQ